MEFEDFSQVPVSKGGCLEGVCATFPGRDSVWLRLPLEMIEMECRKARIQQHRTEMIRGLQLLIRLTGVIVELKSRLMNSK